jgi:uncharacterized YccA/Bax inhibitor family protein
MMRSANPALKASTFEQVVPAEQSTAMTISGTVNKTFLLLLFLVATASYAWNLTGDWRDAVAAEREGTAVASSAAGAVHPGVLIGGGLIAGLIFAMATMFKPTWAPVTAPLYALSEGFFLGALSALADLMYPGIAFQAACLTFCTLGGLLAAYKSGLIRATENFKLGVTAATTGIFLVYVVSMIVNMVGGAGTMPYIHGAGIVGIGFSLFVVVIASLNLVLDFDFIEQGAECRAPKYMEWYGAFGLMVTLVWLYIEILHLLMKLNSRR